MLQIKVKRQEDKKYKKYIESQSECVVGYDCLGDIVCHHTKTIGSGGSDYLGINMCVKHHAELHNIGQGTFQKKYHINFETEIIKLLIGYILKLKGDI